MPLGLSGLIQSVKELYLSNTVIRVVMTPFGILFITPLFSSNLRFLFTVGGVIPNSAAILFTLTFNSLVKPSAYVDKYAYKALTVVFSSGSAITDLDTIPNPFVIRGLLFTELTFINVEQM